MKKTKSSKKIVRKITMSMTSSGVNSVVILIELFDGVQKLWLGLRSCNCIRDGNYIPWVYMRYGGQRRRLVWSEYTLRHFRGTGRLAKATQFQKKPSELSQSKGAPRQ